MMIIGCDFHPRFQQIAFLDQETGECGERRLNHPLEAAEFYRGLPPTQVRIGLEATGSYRWFQRLISELGHELLLGDPAKIRASVVRKQKTDKLDARHMLTLLREGRFPAVWQPSQENEETRQLLLHRCRLVRMRTRVKNQLDSIHPSDQDPSLGTPAIHPSDQDPSLGTPAMAKNEGYLSKRVWCAMRRQQIEALPLTGWYAHRRGDLLFLLDELDTRIEPLDEAVEKAAWADEAARLLMTHPGVGPVVSLAYALTIGDWQRFPRGKQVGSYLGLIPAEESSSDKCRLGHISKQGNSFMRWLLVEAASRAQSSDASWHRQYVRLSMNKHHGVAKVAIAHKLAVRLYWMLRSGHTWQQVMERGSPPQRQRPVAGDPGSHAGQSV
jgi:transposase